jgi:hypothetical protein
VRAADAYNQDRNCKGPFSDQRVQASTTSDAAWRRSSWFNYADAGLERERTLPDSDNQLRSAPIARLPTRRNCTRNFLTESFRRQLLPQLRKHQYGNALTRQSCFTAMDVTRWCLRIPALVHAGRRHPWLKPDSSASTSARCRTPGRFAALPHAEVPFPEHRNFLSSIVVGERVPQLHGRSLARGDIENAGEQFSPER